MIKKIINIAYKIYFKFFLKYRIKKCGKKSFIGQKFQGNFKHLYIGDYSSIGSESLFLNTRANIHIGSYVMIAPRCVIVTGNHRYDIPGLYMQQINDSMKREIDDKDVVIENDVWIGTGVTILKGVKIGEGAIIGASSVVTKDVAPYSIVGGNPAKIIKMRFTDEEIRIHKEKLEI